MENITKERMDAIKNDLNLMINKKIEFDIKNFTENTSVLLEYTEAMEKQLGIEKALNMMKQNNVNTLVDKLEKSERKIKHLEDKLNEITVKQLEDLEKDLELEIQNKKYQIEKYCKTIKKIEQEIIELNDSLNIVY